MARSAWRRRSTRRPRWRSPPGNGASTSAHESEEAGVDVCVSSWQRVAPNTLPALAKAGGNYLSSQLISQEAKRLGFAEGIGLAPDGTVSEGAGENLFLVQGRRAADAGAGALGARRHHARYRDPAGARAGHRGARELDPARAAVPGRRAVLHRHRGRDHPDPLGGSHPGRQRQARADHRDAAAGLLRPVLRRDRRTSGAGSTTSTCSPSAQPRPAAAWTRTGSVSRAERY